MPKEEKTIKPVIDSINVKQVPEVCEGCATGSISYIDIIKPPFKKWVGDPCSLVGKRGKIDPARLQWCVRAYRDDKRKRDK